GEGEGRGGRRKTKGCDLRADLLIRKPERTSGTRTSTRGIRSDRKSRTTRTKKIQ
ncbi:unnamed protein product, partial [Ectocarpus sp. 12 AP-2014]